LESIDSYYNRFQELLEDLNDADEPIAIKTAICQFIFTLGPEFETIQNNICLGSLPIAWTTQDWPTLLTLCQDYYNSVKTHLTTRRNVPSSGDSNFDREALQKKVREWFMQPMKYCHEIEAEQHRVPGKCIYHLSKTHPTCSCFVKKECEKLIAEKKDGPNSQGGHLYLLQIFCATLLMKNLWMPLWMKMLLIQLKIRLMILMMMFWPILLVCLITIYD
jgi:hypothetical protein